MGAPDQGPAERKQVTGQVNVLLVSDCTLGGKLEIYLTFLVVEERFVQKYPQFLRGAFASLTQSPLSNPGTALITHLVSFGSDLSRRRNCN